MTSEHLAAIGGLFALLTFAHFIVDWIFQTHDEAMRKAHEWSVRVNHCLVYAIGMTSACMVLRRDVPFIVGAFSIFFLSHFVEDTYLPVYWWMKYVRRVPTVRTVEGFVSYIQSEPLGLILTIAVDQIIHLAFVLLVAVWLA